MLGFDLILPELNTKGQQRSRSDTTAPAYNVSKGRQHKTDYSQSGSVTS